MRAVEVGGVRLELTDAQVESLRSQLAVPAPEEATGLIDAATAAEHLGVSRDYVYEHAAELGGRKLGAGPKAPWRFNPATLQTGSAPMGQMLPEPRRQRRRPPRKSAPLLEIRG